MLSIGEQQRLALARAWALTPEVLFLDEPTASLDPNATHVIEQVIAAFDAAGTKIIMTTHDLGQARRLADEIVFLHQGRALEISTADDFFAGPIDASALAQPGAPKRPLQSACCLRRPASRTQSRRRIANRLSR